MTKSKKLEKELDIQKQEEYDRKAKSLIEGKLKWLDRMEENLVNAKENVKEAKSNLDELRKEVDAGNDLSSYIQWGTTIEFNCPGPDDLFSVSGFKQKQPAWASS